jgi:hypothetical protein
LKYSFRDDKTDERIGEDIYALIMISPSSNKKERQGNQQLQHYDTKYHFITKRSKRNLYAAYCESNTNCATQSNKTWQQAIYNKENVK